MKQTDKYSKDHFNFKGNQWEEKEDCFAGTDAKGNQFRISKEDYENCSKYCWTKIKGRNPKNGKYFSARMSRKSPEGHKMKMLHNFVWELHNGKIPNNYMVDHKDRDGSNCCNDNLRLATKSQNGANVGLRANNKSGFTGVTLSNGTKWRAYISINGNFMTIGYYYNKEEAVKARLEAEAKYFGEFAPQRHLFEKYGVDVNNE